MTSTALKIIALISMTIDHTFKILFNQYGLIKIFGMDIQGSYALIDVTRFLGRFAFPIFAFCIAESCIHTKNKGNYLLRLLFAGIISEIPFQLSFDFGQLRFATTNIFFTLFLGAFLCMLYDLFSTKHIRWVFIPLLIVAAVLAELLGVDYGGAGVIMIVVAYILKNRWLRFIAMVAVNCYLYIFVSNSVFLLIGAIIGVGFTLFYNGLRGRKFKWSFYLYYPTHLAVLYMFAQLLGTSLTVHT